MNVPLVQIHVRLLADQVAVAAAHTLDFGQGVHDFLFAIDLQSLMLATSLHCAAHQFHRQFFAMGAWRRTLVLRRRKMNWKFDFSPETSDIFAVWGCCRCRGDGVRSLVCGFRDALRWILVGSWQESSHVLIDISWQAGKAVANDIRPMPLELSSKASISILQNIV